MTNRAPADDPLLGVFAPFVQEQIRYRRYILPLIIAALVTALALGPMAIARGSGPLQPWIYLPVLAYVIGLEAVATTRWLLQPTQRQTNRLVYRLAELSIIVFALRLLTWALYGWPSLEQLRGYLLSPASIVDGVFFGHLFILCFVWFIAIAFADLLYQLVVRREEVEIFRRDFEQRAIRLAELFGNQANDRPSLLRRFFTQWLYSSLILVVCAAVTAYDWRPALAENGSIRNIVNLGLQPEILVGLLIYFLLGLWLLSWGRLQVLQVRWLVAQHEPEPVINRVWRRQSLAILLGVALLAAFLPIGSTVPIAVLIGFAYRGLIAVGTFIIGLLVLVISFLLALFSGNDDATPTPDPTALPELTPTVPLGAVPPAPPNETLQLILGGAVWLIVAIVIVTLTLFYMRERGFQLNSAGAALFWKSFRAWWQRLRGGVTERASGITQALRRLRRPRESERKAPPWRFVRINGLSPRDQIRYFYLSTVRRARDRGVVRPPDKTPLEFVAHLKDTWPESEAELEQLTDAFLQARYSPRPVKPDEATAVKRVWKRVKGGVRRRRPAPRAPGSDDTDNAPSRHEHS